MKTLREVLRRLERNSLDRLAARWDVRDAKTFPTATELIDRLAPKILNSDRLRERFENAPNGTDEVLSVILRAEGRFPTSALRSDAAEFLTEMGILYTSYETTESGIDEFFFIPSDLRPFFDAKPVENGSVGDFIQVRPASPSETGKVIPARCDFYDVVILTLASARVPKPMELVSDAYGESRQLLAARTAIAAKILGSPDEPTGEAIQEFLTAYPGQSLNRLIRAWVDDSTVDEVRDSGLFDIDAHFDTRISALRANVLSMLRRVESNGWVSYRSFLTTIRSIEPDFFRDLRLTPQWMISRKLTGDGSGWDAVEGTVLRLLLTGALHDFGIIDIAAPASDSLRAQSDGSDFSAFRISLFGRRILNRFGGEDVPETTTRVETASVGVDGRILIPARVQPVIRYHLARYCDWEELRTDRWTFRLTPSSLRLAKENGLKVSGLISLLRRSLGNTVPGMLLNAIETWDKNETEVEIEEAILVRDRSEKRIDAVLSSKDCARYIVARLNPTTLMISAKGIKAIRRKMAELGVLTEVNLSDEREINVEKENK